jgi:hypothetical protein
MRARVLSVAVVLGIFSAAGCGGGGGGGLQPPSSVTFEQGEPFDQVIVRWVAPPGPVDAYELSGRTGGGVWEAPVTIPAPADGVYATLDASVPELVTLGVRVRSVRRTFTSAWSPEATLFRSVRPPTGLIASISAVEPSGNHVPPVHLSWSNASAVATALQVERAPWLDPNPVYTPVATLAASAIAFDDEGVTEGQWTYRIRAGAGTRWGPWTSTWTNEAVDIVPPRGLVVTKEPDQIRVTWTNGSARAEQVVDRVSPTTTGGGAEAVLPVGSHEYVDPLATPWPATGYRVTAVIPGFPVPAVATDEVLVGKFTLTGPPALDASARRTPDALVYTLTDGGQLHALSQPSGSDEDRFAIERDTGAGWEHHVLMGAKGFAQPGLLADPEGRPHAVFYRGYPGAVNSTLVHAWHDGTDWREDVITTEAADGARFGVGPGGVAHVLAWPQLEPDTCFHYVVADGDVTATELAPTVLPEPPGVGPFGIFNRSVSVAADGTLWLDLSYQSAPVYEFYHVLMRRSAAGAWSQELAPVPLDAPGASVHGASAEVAALFYEGMPYVWNVRFRTAAGFGPEETVPLPVDWPEFQDAAVAPDGVRMSVLESRYPDGLWLSTRGAEGWSVMLLGTPSSRARAGFTADGRATVVVMHGLGGGSSTQAWVSLFAEPPP